MKHPFRYRSGLAVLITWLSVMAPTFAEADDLIQGKIIAPDEPTPIMPVDQVRIGMKGYGLTVFQGTQIEPFAVEVLSIVSNDTPGRDLIWVKCHDPRLEVSGPIQGMSGSPIFLWEEGEEGQIGEGGRLIGAFAFGSALVKECIAGIQPIEYMRQAGQRAADQSPQSQPRQVKTGASLGTSTLQMLARAPTYQQLDTNYRFRADLLYRLMHGGEEPKRPATSSPLPTEVKTPTESSAIQPLMLPLSVGTPQTAQAVSPLFASMRMQPLANATALGNRPPPSIDRDTPIEPGSVLSIPFVIGDATYSANGTVTDVLPDGTVLGFGHPMFDEGRVAMPMATGYVHTVMPLLTISYKMADSLQLAGSIVQDEAAAVAGVATKTFETAPISLTVRQPGLEERRLNFQTIHHPQLTPLIVGTVLYDSIQTVQTPHPKSTARLTGTFTFEGGRTITLDNTLLLHMPEMLLIETAGPLSVASENFFEPLRMTAAEVTVEIEDGFRVAELTRVRTDRSTYQPGQTVKLRAHFQTFEGPAFTKVFDFKLPEDLPSGETEIYLVDAGNYASRLPYIKPYLFNVDSVDSLIAAVNQMTRIDRESLYIVLPRNDQAIAVGDQDLRGLPSSRGVILEQAAGSDAVYYQPVLEKQIAMEQLLFANHSVPIRIVIEGEER